MMSTLNSRNDSILLAFLVVLGCCCCTSLALSASTVQLPDHRELQNQVEAGGILTDVVDIKLSDNISNDVEAELLAQTIAQDAHCETPTRIFRPSQDPNVEARHRACGLHLHFRMNCESSVSSSSSNPNNVRGQGSQAALQKLSKKLSQDPYRYANLISVEVEPEIVEQVVPGSTVPILDMVHQNKTSQQQQQHEHRLLATSNDPLLQFQEHYGTIRLFEAWDLMNDNNNAGWQNAPNVVVQVLDSGTDLLHEDLSQNVWNNADEVCVVGSNNDNDGNGYINDCHGYNHGDDTGWPITALRGNDDHGSHCAGTIAATTGNGVGLAGVAGGRTGFPGVSVMTSTAFGQQTTGGSEDALVYGADNGAHISSNSWGYTSPNVFPSALQDAIDYAVNQNVLVVFAAGNDNSNANYYPGRYEKVIAVAATAQTSGVRASFSNYGSWVDISAPGENVASTSFANDYVYKSGTSMACPHVSGVLALGKALRPASTNEELKTCLFSRAVNIDALNPSYQGQLGAGLMDAQGFLQCVQELDNAATTSPPTNAPTPVSTTVPPTTSPTPSPSSPLCNGDGSCGGSCGNCHSERGPSSTGCSCEACQCRVCALRPSCCTEQYDSLCAEIAQTQCACAQPLCGDGIVQAGKEVCDVGGVFAPNVASTCQEAGFLDEQDPDGGDSGTLGCSPDCQSIETTRCRKVIFEQNGLSGAQGSVYRETVPIQYATEYIRFEITGNGDADLYVGIGAPPSNTVYNCRPYRNGSQEACVGQGTANARDVYHIMLIAYRDYSNVRVRVITDGLQQEEPTTAAPTPAPTQIPTQNPTAAPSDAPSAKPTQTPTASPFLRPTKAPTPSPSRSPTQPPTTAPSTEREGCIADCQAAEREMTSQLGISDNDLTLWCQEKCQCEETVADIFPAYGSDFDKVLLSCRCAAASNLLTLNLVQCGNCVPACRDMFSLEAKVDWCDEACTQTYQTCGFAAGFASCVVEEFCAAANAAGDAENPGFGPSSGLACTI